MRIILMEKNIIAAPYNGIYKYCFSYLSALFVGAVTEPDPCLSGNHLTLDHADRSTAVLIKPGKYHSCYNICINHRFKMTLWYI